MLAGWMFRSCIDVAERASKGAHCIALNYVGELIREHVTERHGVFESTVTTRRGVQEGKSVGDGILAVFDVLVLPDPPSAVDLRMMDYIIVSLSPQSTLL